MFGRVLTATCEERDGAAKPGLLPRGGAAKNGWRPRRPRPSNHHTDHDRRRSNGRHEWTGRTTRWRRTTPDAGVPPPDASGPTAGAITSHDEGSDLDHIRTAIHALQLYDEENHDDVELAKVHKCIVGLPVDPGRPL